MCVYIYIKNAIIQQAAPKMVMYRLTRHRVLPSRPSGKPFLSVYFRNEEGTAANEKLSVREMDPLP